MNVKKQHSSIWKLFCSVAEPIPGVQKCTELGGGCVKGGFGWQVSLCPHEEAGDGAGARGRGMDGGVLGMLRAGQQCGNVMWGGSGVQGEDLKTLLWWKLGGIGLAVSKSREPRSGCPLGAA